mgnify:CR=1 FL=1
MSKLTNEAIEMLHGLQGLEQKCCLSMMSRLEHLGLAHHASDAICSLAACDVMPIKK